MRDINEPRNFKSKYTKEQALALVEKAYEKEEPIFIIIPQDAVAPIAIKHYAELCKDLAKGDFASKAYEHGVSVERFVTVILEWQFLNKDQVKDPD
ncbi:hypothetical protein LCGC14_0337210 [marine sediment metagenome]|uniref:Uncharacterized protein n=1 Tax=marine sediment metagenome TaxID=412755 RepID=A0A0F9TK87_9ZZZZ